MSDLTPNEFTYQALITQISDCLRQGQIQAARQVNVILLQTYWQIGRYIVEFEQAGQERAEYGSRLLSQLSKDLKATHGKGFSRTNLQYMRLLYLIYPNCQTLSGNLSWSHYTELLAISDDLARSFYAQQCIQENWSVRELSKICHGFYLQSAFCISLSALFTRQTSSTAGITTSFAELDRKIFQLERHPLFRFALTPSPSPMGRGEPEFFKVPLSLGEGFRERASIRPMSFGSFLGTLCPHPQPLSQEGEGG